MIFCRYGLTQSEMRVKIHYRGKILSFYACINLQGEIMDIYVEQLIQKKSQPIDHIKRAAIVLAGLVLSIAVVVFSIIIRFLMLAIFAAGIIYFTVKLLAESSVEYEYIVTNDCLDIDKIMGRSRRKRLISLDLRETTDFSLYKQNAETKAETTVVATAGTDQNNCILIVNHSKHGKTAVVFTPDKRVKDAIKSVLPYSIRNNSNLPD